jgi:hypothetical protein
MDVLTSYLFSSNKAIQMVSSALVTDFIFMRMVFSSSSRLSVLIAVKSMSRTSLDFSTARSESTINENAKRSEGEG